MAQFIGGILVGILSAIYAPDMFAGAVDLTRDGIAWAKASL